MPYYEYTCTPCELVTMLSRPIANRDDNVTCITCDQPMKRTYISPSIAFKGNGFYSTDKENK